MALINCSECQKQISDKAESCPHCGCPVSFSVNTLNDNDLVIQKALKLGNYQLINSIKIYRDLTGIDLKESKYIIENALADYKNKSNSHKQTIAKEVDQSLPKCPNCNSNRITKISGMSKAGSITLFGIFATGKVSKTFNGSVARTV